MEHSDYDSADEDLYPVNSGYQRQYSMEPIEQDMDDHTHPQRQLYGAQYIDPIDDWEDQQQDAPAEYLPQTQSAYDSQVNRFSNSSWQQQPRSMPPAQQWAPPLALPQAQIQRGANPRNAHGIRLRPVSDLPDIYRGLFKFGVFNAVQSGCFDTVLDSGHNAVISAPTGSGKTVLFELAIIRMLTEAKNTGQSFKAIYVAPTKALCSERFRDWSSKFEPLGVKCAELTGDTVIFGRGAWGEAKHASIIITTSEKWDSLTRNWDDTQVLLNQISLFLVDEVHILNESRGSVLEVIMSRMRQRGNDVRFIMVSATVPNIEDIAAWVRLDPHSSAPAKVFEYGEEFRPCKLTRYVVGVPRTKHSNDFLFNRNLDFKLFGVLQKYSVGKAILVFVSTRKGTVQTAETLKKEFIEAEQKKADTPWARPRRIDHVFQDKTLDELAAVGIGIHHAGLQFEDRRAVEDFYLKGVLRVVVATTTLAVGINLPAHTVVIKGVMTFSDGAAVEYSDLDIMQMLGRAGRPQFDKEGIAVILCETELENKYRSLAQGRTILESSLHTNLVEHLNSEIGLGTITNITSAKAWLRQSFLFQRIQKNPRHYSVGKDDNQTWEERVDEMVTSSVGVLRRAQLVEKPSPEGNSDELVVTEYGDIMSRFYIRQSTMSQILALPEKAGLKDILALVASCEEVITSPLRASEKAPLRVLAKHTEIRFPVKKVETSGDKMMLLIQAQLACINLNAAEFKSNDSQLTFGMFNAFKHLPRVLRAVIEVATTRRFGSHMKFGLELLRSISAKAWDDRPYVLRQIESIGEKSIKVLTENGIGTMEKLRIQDPLRLENLLNRRPPFGLEVLGALKELPHYKLTITEIEKRASGNGTDPVKVDLQIDCGIVEETRAALKTKKRKTRSSNVTHVLTVTSDLDFVDFRRIGTKALVDGRSFELEGIELTKPSQSIIVYISSDSIAGITVSGVYKPNLASRCYPTPDTRPASEEMDLSDIGPEFWDIDDLDVPTPVGAPPPPAAVIRDLTKKKVDERRPGPQQGSSPSKASSKTVTSKAKENANALLAKRSDGKYDCNHSCKDKTACRHLCCREGLEDPPKRRAGPAASASKNTKVDAGWKVKPKPVAPQSPQASFGHIVKQEDSKSRKPPVNEDTTMAELEDLHRRTNVAESIKLQEGKRIKIDSAAAALPATSRSKRLKGPPPDFSIELSDLKADDKPPTHSTFPDFFDDEDDEILDPSSLLSQLPSKLSNASERSSDSDEYADPEFDALMRDMPPNDHLFSSSAPSPQAVPSRPTLKRKAPSPGPAPTSLGTSNVPHFNTQPQPGFKKARMDRDRFAPSLARESTFEASRLRAPKVVEPELFLPTDDSDDEVPVASNDTEPTAGVSLSGQTEMAARATDEDEMDEDDDFADLERWLKKGGVKIVG